MSACAPALFSAPFVFENETAKRLGNGTTWCVRHLNSRQAPSGGVVVSMQLKACALVMMMTALSAQAAESLRDSASQDSASQQALARPLDLKLAPLSHIFTPQQIDAVLSRAVDPALESVEVEATRLRDLPFQDNSASVAQTTFNTVVRWLTPSSLYASNVNDTPDATNPFRPAPVLASSYHASFPPPYSQR